MRKTYSADGTNGRRSAFTLVELMVVIGIIALLAGIALPAFSQARISVKKATSKAAIAAIDAGIAQLRADERFGGSYPPSYYVSTKSPYTTANDATFIYVGGAGLIVWALAGADLLGTAGFRDLDHLNENAIAPWTNDTGATAGRLYQVSGSTPVQPRSSFVDTSKMKFSTRRADSLFEIPAGKQALPAQCFLDAFDQPILYYKANPGRASLACDDNPDAPTGIYNMRDNLNITGSANLGDSGLDFGAGAGHFQNGNLGTVTFPRPLPPDPNSEPQPRGSFAWTIYNPSSTVWAPYNPETYILLSAGPDGLFGTPDDIANYEMNK